MINNKSLKKDLSIALLLTVLSLIGLIFITIFQFNNFPEEMLKESIPENISVSMAMILTIVQSSIMTFIMAFAGLKLAKSVNLNKGIFEFIYNKDNILKCK